MKLTELEVRALARTVGLDVPDSDIEDLTARINFYFLAVEELERDLGDDLYRLEPVPPVYPREDLPGGRPPSA